MKNLPRESQAIVLTGFDFFSFYVEHSNLYALSDQALL